MFNVLCLYVDSMDSHSNSDIMDVKSLLVSCGVVHCWDPALWARVLNFPKHYILCNFRNLGIVHDLEEYHDKKSHTSQT